MILIVLLMFITPCKTKICFSELELCSNCNNTYAICDTSAIDAAVPQNLSTELQTLTIRYNGPKLQLTGDMFKRYPLIDSLALSGKISSLAEETFATLQFLRKLSITYSYLESLPDSLFHPNNSLWSLEIGNNKLSAIPDHLFKELQTLEYLDLAYNNIRHDNCKSVGSAFNHLSNLRSLNIANLTLNISCERSANPKFFLPLQNSTESLILESTNILSGRFRHTLLQNFTKLRILDISLAVGDLSSCPGVSAEKLFQTLPSTLESLIVKRWRPNDDASCKINKATIAGLKKLPKLRLLDFQYSQQLFDDKSNELFAGFQSLEYLNLRWCFIRQLHENSFNGCKNLRWLRLDGNPLGNFLSHKPLKFHINGKDALFNGSKLASIGLAHTLLYSDFSIDIRLYRQLASSKSLEELNLTGNAIYRMPIFHNETHYNKGYKIRTILLGYNYLKNLVSSSGKHFNESCGQLSNLYRLSLRSNRLQDITGLCVSIRELDLADNPHIEDDWEHNEDQIAKLVNLETLSLYGNQIDNISDNIFKKLINLTDVNLGDNNLSVISVNLFRNNKKLEVIDLRYNLLKQVKSKLFIHLSNLRYLNLLDNQITYLDQDLTQFFESSSALAEIILLDNPFSCKCSQTHVQHFIRTTSKVPDAQELICAGPTSELRGQRVFAYERDKFFCDHQKNVIIAGSVLGGFLVTLLVALPCYKYRWYFKHLRTVFFAVLNRINEVRFHYKCQYDAVVIYNSDSEEDCDFLVNQLCPEVEETTTRTNDKVSHVTCLELIKVLI